MKKFRLLFVAGLLALAGSAQAQDGKKTSLVADDVMIANGETAQLVIKIDYETTETVIGANFSLYLPDGIILDGFADKAAMMDAKKKALQKACEIDEEDNPWGEDGDASFFYDIKPKADGGLLFILMDSDKTPFVSCKCKLVTITLKALEQVEGTGSIKGVAFTSNKDESLDLGNLADYEFGVNQTQGINDINANETNAPIYNLNGVRVNGSAKGLLIQEGKKFMVK